jgi:hypothetical protein
MAFLGPRASGPHYSTNQSAGQRPAVPGGANA